MADGELGPGIPGVISHYRLLRRLGTGGMGAVFEAQDRRDESRVAIKLLHPHLATDESFRERFEREAHVAALLRSPYTVKLLDYGNAEGFFYLVMEFIDGQSVAQLIEREGRVDPKRALAIAADAARALEEAEARGVVHRDIKPDNILLGEHQSVKVADFGIARRAGSGGDLTTAGGFIGTTTYAAPEQGESNEVDHRADIYALGATLYCMLAGQPPFRADSPFEVLRQHREAAIPMGPLAGYPDAVVNIIRRCMEKDPADRYESATQLVGALERAQRALSSAGGTAAGAAGTVVAAAPTPSAALEITQVATPSGAIASRTSGGVEETAVGTGAGTPPAPPFATSTPGGGGAGKRRGLLLALAGVAGVAVIGTVAAVFVAGGGDDTPSSGDDDDEPSAAQQTREVKTATARAHATRDAKTESAGDGTPSPAASNTASSASASTTPASSPTRASSAAVPPATATVRPPTATPVPPFIVSGEWTYNFTTTQNTCGSGSEVGETWEVVLTYKDANGDGRIYAGELVTVVDTGQTGNTVGTYTFSYPKFEFRAGLVDGDAVVFKNTFSSDSSGSAVREDQYTVNGEKCVIIYED